MALLKEAEWDGLFGRVTNANLAEYLVPVCADAMKLDAIFVPGEDIVLSLLGSKGLAELGLCGVALPCWTPQYRFAQLAFIADHLFGNVGSPVEAPVLLPHRWSGVLIETKFTRDEEALLRFPRSVDAIDSVGAALTCRCRRWRKFAPISIQWRLRRSASRAHSMRRRDRARGTRAQGCEPLPRTREPKP